MQVYYTPSVPTALPNPHSKNFFNSTWALATFKLRNRYDMHHHPGPNLKTNKSAQNLTTTCVVNIKEGKKQQWLTSQWQKLLRRKGGDGIVGGYQNPLEACRRNQASARKRGRGVVGSNGYSVHLQTWKGIALHCVVVNAVGSLAMALRWCVDIGGLSRKWSWGVLSLKGVWGCGLGLVGFQSTHMFAIVPFF